MRIRYASRIAFDRNGVHATGREVYREILPDFWGWVDEYENDDTVDLPVTDPDAPEEDDLYDLYDFLAEWEAEGWK